MILRLALFVLSLAPLISATKYQKYLCTETHNVYLHPQEIAFFESPNFPSMLIGNDTTNCYMNITIEVLSAQTIYNGIKPLVIYTMDETNRMFYTDSYTLSFGPWGITNLRGYIYLDEWNDACLFESFSRINPFFISDDSIVIILQSQIGSFEHSCLWQFTAPEGYGFKLYIKNIIFSNTTRFTVDNSDSIVATERMFKSEKAHYYRDNYIKLSLTESNYTHIVNFDAYITIVKNEVKVNEGNCSIRNENDVLTWSNYNNETGYARNSKCSFKLVIPPKTEVNVRVEGMTQIESRVDKINYYYDGNIKSKPIDITSFPLNNIVMDAKNENTSRNVLWEFISDGSMQYFGFTLTFTKIQCSCADSIFIVPCDGENIYNIMKGSHSTYCGNLNCNFSFVTNSTCPSKLFRLEISLSTPAESFTEIGEIFDIFRIISDNKTYLEINYLKRSNYNIFLPISAHHVFQAITVSSFYTRTMSLTLSSIKLPQLPTKIILTKDQPWHAIFLYTSNQFLTIELSSEFVNENETLKIHAISDLYNLVTFYQDETLQKELDLRKCYTSSKTFECETTKTKMAFLIHSKARNVVFIQSTQSVSKGCVFKNNVKMLTTEKMSKNDAMRTSIISTIKSICQTFIIVDKQDYKIKNIWKSPSSKGIFKIYAGDLKKPVVKIDMKTINYWHDVKLNSLFYIFELPKSSSVIIDFNELIDGQIATFPYYSFATSPFFGFRNMTICQNDIYNSLTEPIYNPSYNTTVKVKLLSYASDASTDVIIETPYDAIPINSSFDSMILSNIFFFTFQLSISDSSEQCGFFLEYVFLIESLESNISGPVTTSTTQEVTTTTAITTMTTTKTESSTVSGCKSFSRNSYVFISLLLVIQFLIFSLS